MKIKNVRMGFATNSSSSHSIIIAGTNNSKLTSKKDSNDLGFGWERFICDDKESKTRYFASQLFTTLSGHLGEDTTAYVVKGLFGISLEKGQYGWDSHVDHQSRWDIPGDFDGKPNLAFYKEFAESVIENEGIHVLGGNDNSSYDDENQIQEPKQYSWLREITESHDLVKTLVAFKTKHDDWVLFNKNTGTKIVLNFNDKEVTNAKPEFPELIDLKITDYCPIGCTYCYQNSTPQGGSAPLEVIRSLIPYDNKGLFEIALGGGEPTMHPEFLDILKAIDKAGIVANFTTKSAKWMSSMNVFDILEHTGSFAYSIDNRYELERILDKYTALCNIDDSHRKDYRGKINFQYIPEGNELSDLEEIVKSLTERNFNNSLTLLGYKSVGRGGKKPYNHKLIDELVRLHKKYNFWFKIGIDTVLAKTFKDDLAKQNISDVLYYKDEGKHSMYIDAVESKYGASSFTEKYHPLDNLYEKSYSHFGSIRLEELFAKVDIE